MFIACVQNNQKTSQPRIKLWVLSSELIFLWYIKLKTRMEKCSRKWVRRAQQWLIRASSAPYQAGRADNKYRGGLHRNTNGLRQRFVFLPLMKGSTYSAPARHLCFSYLEFPERDERERRSEFPILWSEAKGPKIKRLLKNMSRWTQPNYERVARKDGLSRWKGATWENVQWILDVP